MTIYKGTTAGTFQTVDAIGPDLGADDQVKSEQINNLNSYDGDRNHTGELGPVAAHLDDLYQRSAIRLNETEEVHLKKLLLKNQALFSK